MKNALVVLCAFGLVGCAHNPTPPQPCPPPTVKIVEVEVPVPVYPSVVVPTRPTLAIDEITDTSKPGVVANAYRITVAQLREYAIELETLLKSVNNPEPK